MELKLCLKARNEGILLSPSYRVPVVYFHVKDSHGSPVTDQAAVLSGVVPVSLKDQVAGAGVLGGISMTVTHEASCSQHFRPFC